MRHWLFLSLLLVIVTSGYAKSTIDFGQYSALVIGNNEYDYLPDLKTAVADAEAVSKVLERKYRFNVTLLKNARRSTILEALNKITSQLTEKDNLLIYYAGHGTLDKYTDTGYWQPVEATSESDTFWIPTTDINRYLTRMNAKHVLVIADSCYAGSLLTRGETSHLQTGEEPKTWLRRMLEQRSRTALTSGWLEPVQDRGSGAHSVFAEVLLNILHENDNILDGHSLFQQLKRPVTTRASGSQQIPQYADIKSPKHEGGDFLLVPNTLQDMEIDLFTPSNLPDWLFRGEGGLERIVHCSKPTVPVLVEPRQDGVQPNHYYGQGEPWKFSWLESTCDGGSIIKYQLIVYAQGYSNAYQDILVDEPYYVGSTGGTVGSHSFQWKVRALDDKNQFSDWSETRRFTVPRWDVIDISPKRKTVYLNENKITMEPGTGFILSTHEITSGIGADRDIWWNNLELVPDDRMCSIGHIEDLNAIKKISKRCILKFAGFVPQEGEGFLLEILRNYKKQYAVIRVDSIEEKKGRWDSKYSITLEWMYPYKIPK
jgi:hypothetical protein